MKRVIQAIVLSSMFALPAFAQDSMMAENMSCADFTAMNSEGQMKAVEEMQMASEKMESGEMMSGEMKSDEMKSDSMASDGMKSDEMKSDAMASDGMKSDEMKSEGMMADDMTAAIVKACEGHPDMMAMDAMKEASKM